jgi:malonyl-CoA/methylmalonyl-CoA synthetase
MNSVLEQFLQHCDKTPNKRCIVFEQNTESYAQFKHRVLRWVTALNDLGALPKDRVALFCDNTADFLAVFLATHWLNATVVLVNTAYKQVELRHILSDSAAKICITDTTRLAEIERVRTDLPDLLNVVNIDDTARHLPLPADKPRQLPAADDIGVIAYTSGTTGRSKGAMLLHRNMLANIQSVSEAWHWSAGDHLLLTLPLFHVHGLLVGFHGTLCNGASLELYRSFDVKVVYERLLTGEFSLFFGVPTMYTRLVQEANKRTVLPPPLRLYVCGSAALSADLLIEFERIFGQRILERYGMTETIMNLTNPYEGERRPGTVGMPFPRQEVRIVHVRTREILPHDQDGEIEMRGPNVFPGYLNRPDATAESFSPDGWFKTGDLGRISDDGYVTINGRAKELIISGGFNIYPREVEEVLANCPGVAEIAVLGIADKEFGEHVAAVVVRNDLNLTSEQLIAFCKDNLASYKKPKIIKFVESLPRNAMGKVQKHLIKIE